MKLYKQADASKELPDHNNWVTVFTLDGSQGIVIYDKGKWRVEKDGEEWWYSDEITHWLKPITLSDLIDELVTEEEMVEVIDEWTRKSFGRKILNVEYRALSKAILQLLKNKAG